ncbi:MAG TPA: PKD domain-containing protein, partial [Thermoanaerobaculia bacterium]|nr:PKD domain-containing protein [Thermoanaerobaculia bacterium]
MTRLQKFALAALLAVAAAMPLSAQTTSGYWVEPAQTPNTDVTCSTCPCNGPGNCSYNMKTIGYPATMGRYVGRYLDSQHTNDFQQPFRTGRARNVVAVPSTGRVYFIMGSALFAYDLDRFFTRVGGHEALTSAMLFGGRPGWPANGTWEKFLQWDQMFYAERSTWDTSTGGDGQERLFAIDADDQGYVYLATEWYGWGIVKDDKTADGSNMQSPYQYSVKMQKNDDVPPQMIAVLKSATNGSYYALIGDTTSNNTNVFDVTSRSSPSKLATVKRLLFRWAKTSDMSRIGIITSDGKFEVYTADAYAQGGGQPLISDTLSGGTYASVACDGTNFYVSADLPSGMLIRTFAPNGNGAGYHRVADLQTSRANLATLVMKYGEGYLAAASFTDGGYEERLFKGGVNGLTEVNLQVASGSPAAYYMKQYYVRTGLTGYTAPGTFGLFVDPGAIVRSAGHTYFIVTAYGLGDVYELGGADVINIRNSGSVGAPNPNRPAGSSAGPFYGDPIGFTGTTSSGTAATIQFDFGNPEAAAGADPNTANASTGTQVTHRYSGITTAAALPLNRTVKATNIVDANVTGSGAVSMALPTVGVGVKNFKSLLLQSNASSSAPIVVGDEFIDQSDGSVESHFTTWTLGNVSTNTKPNETVSVGACTSSRTFSMMAHYGPYIGNSPNEVSLSDLPFSITGAKYSVRPFAPSIDVGSSASQVTFTSSSRFTADTSVLPAAQLAALQWKWELLDASNQVVATNPAAPTGTGPVIAPYNVAKSVFANKVLHAHLVITSSALSGACAGFETADAVTVDLKGPNPTITGGCTTSGNVVTPPCSFSVASGTPGVDPAADGWTYVWSVDGVVANGGAQTFKPTFATSGQHTISVAVTNAVATANTSTTVTLTKVSSCQPVTPGQTIFIYYTGSSTGCSFNSTCNAGESINFSANAGFGYDFSCSAHTFSWDFGDRGTGTGRTPSHAYSAAGTYTVTLVATNDTGPYTMTQDVSVGSAPVQPPPVQPPPVQPPPVQPPPVGGCGLLDANTFFVYYANAANTCSIYSSNACSTGDAINFSAAPNFGYNINCGSHTWQWNFGDGTTANAQSPSHAYANGGTYTVSVRVSNPSSSTTYSATVLVAGGGGTQPPPSQPPPSQPPPVTPPPTGSCKTITPGQNVFIYYTGPSSQCSFVFGSCQTGESVAFSVEKSADYDFNCAQHTFSWDFKDGTDPQSGKAASHVFANAGTYNVTVNVTVNGVTTPISQQVTVSGTPIGGGTPPGPGEIPFDFTIEPYQVNGTMIPHAYVV